MPFNGLPSFLHSRNPAADTLICSMCQCPLTGFLHFYEEKKKKEMKELWMCQCPLTGFLHFYVKVTGLGEVKANVSMPFNGLPSFLPCACCRHSGASVVSMPFNGLPSFLHWLAIDVPIKNKLCQCPLTGFLHFYGNIRIYWMKQILVCQCPLTGFLHFYIAEILRQIP